MINFKAALKRKQDALAKNAEAALIRAKAAARLSNARAGEITGENSTSLTQQGQSVDLSGLQTLLGNRLRGGGGGLPGATTQPPVPGASGLNFGQSVGTGRQSLTTPPTGGPQQQRQSTSTAPLGFGLPTDSDSRRGRIRVFGSLFDKSRGL